MRVLEQLEKTLALIKLERQADLEYYRQKVLLRSLQQRTKEGTTWYPLRFHKYFIGTGERFIVEVERTNNMDQPHTFQSGKSVSLFSNAEGKPEKHHANGVINFVRDNLMQITLNTEDAPDWLEDGLLGVDVMFDEMSYREMEYALNEVMKAENNRIATFRDLLLGSAEIDDKERYDYTPEHIATLNASQQEALKKVMATQDVAFIHGPPGTGKTTTLVESIYATVKREHQVLVCAPSNAAVDLLAEKLSNKGLSVLRIGHPARVTEQSLSKTLDAQITQHDHYNELRELRKRMERIKSSALKFKKNFGFHERQERKLMLQEAKLLKSDADMLEFYIINDLLQKTQVICSTLVGSSHPTLRGKKFQTVFIDEAAQALEAACWIPLLRSERAIFAGDHQQLPPTIKSNEAARQGLAVTLFEKGITKHPKQAVMLQVQYRMHEDIMRFSSQYFYNNQLLAHDSVKNETLALNQSAVEFIDTAGCGHAEKQDPETLSRSNPEEADLLLQHLERLVEEIGVEQWIEQELSLGIITPYRAQVDYIKKRMEGISIWEALSDLITVHTVDAFQGQERDIMAISFVRSNDKAEVGFLGDVRRTNVAMTRAKKKLIMMGDSATLSSHPFYLALIDFVQQKSFYKSAFEIMY
jgi:ATP-dependent RNA/DNA helicase IGHMBP2